MSPTSLHYIHCWKCTDRTMDTFLFFCREFLQDVLYQKLSKFIDFSELFKKLMGDCKGIFWDTFGCFCEIWLYSICEYCECSEAREIMNGGICRRPVVMRLTKWGDCTSSNISKWWTHRYMGCRSTQCLSLSSSMMCAAFWLVCRLVVSIGRTMEAHRFVYFCSFLCLVFLSQCLSSN